MFQTAGVFIGSCYTVYNNPRSDRSWERMMEWRRLIRENFLFGRTRLRWIQEFDERLNLLHNEFDLDHLINFTLSGGHFVSTHVYRRWYHLYTQDGKTYRIYSFLPKFFLADSPSFSLHSFLTSLRCYIPSANFTDFVH